MPNHLFPTTLQQWDGGREASRVGDCVAAAEYLLSLGIAFFFLKGGPKRKTPVVLLGKTRGKLLTISIS